MRLEEHVAFSTAAALVALPWLKEEIWLPYTASILIDVDHYLEFVAARRRLSLREALRYLRTPHRQRGPLPKPLHHPLTLSALAALAALTRQRWLWLVLAGMLFHVSLDACNNELVRGIQRQLQREAAGRCPGCARQVSRLELHARRPLRSLLARYQRANYVVLCPECHRLVHQQRQTAVAIAGDSR
ncbi:hypothetical protein [Thermogemmatispora carboxidivorans]|uniref:hypothetical protein n=1 Tax=Thermogemmatispora carboxidivorans TaxID=1382306 RepID=UPI00069C333B|nr:hypothetical protein [Thermogemmatispora carboxidivorans]